MAAGLLLAVSAGSWAQSASIDLHFDRVPVYELLRVIFGEVLKEPYLMDAAVVREDRYTSLDLRGASIEQVRVLLRETLAQQGLSVRRVDLLNVVDIKKADAEPMEVYTYRPRYRTTSYLESSIRSFVSRGRFGGISMATGQAGPAAAGASGVMPGAVPASSGTAAPAANASAVQVTNIGGIAAGQRDVVTFQGPAAEVELVRRLVETLDVRAAEIVVRASVFEVQTTKDESSGVQIAYSLLGGVVTGGVGAVGAPLVRFVKGGFDVAVSKLASDSRFNLVSSPSLRVSSGESARVVVGQDVPVLGGVALPANGAPVQSVNYQSSGVMLDITPVALEEMVKLTLRQEISDFAATNTGVNASPTLLKRAVSSVVSLQSGEVVFIGGLDETNQTGSKSGVPWLPGWMGSMDSVQKKTELVVMLQVDVLR
jgi:hypothetical protein